MRIFVTRPQAQAHDWAQALQQAGFNAVALPLIETRPTSDPQAVQTAWQALAQWDALMFVSANAIDAFFSARPHSAMPLASPPPRCWVTGPGSRAALLRWGVDAAAVDAPGADAAQFDSEALWQVVAPTVGVRTRVLIVRGTTAHSGGQLPAGVGRDWFAQQLAGAGAQVDFVVSYERCPPRWDAATQAQALRAASDGSVWIFSASEALDNLVQLCPGQGWAAARCVVTHPRIAQAARQAGFGVVCESRPDLLNVTSTLKSLA